MVYHYLNSGWNSGRMDRMSRGGHYAPDFWSTLTGNITSVGIELSDEIPIVLPLSLYTFLGIETTILTSL